MKKFISILIAITIIFGLLPTSSAGAVAANDLKVHFIDVGQGDAILVQSPGGRNMLIDAGPVSAGKKVVSFLKAKGVKKLDFVVATHPDADHIGGLETVLNSFPVGQFIDSGKVHTTQVYFNLLKLIDKKKIKFSVPKVSGTLNLDYKLKVQVLSVNPKAKDINDASIVLKVTYNKVSFLLMGDADADIEKIIQSKYNIQATVLKNGHHGSNTSSSAAFINKVKPKVSILSYGKSNSYGHPHKDVVSRLTKVKAKTYKTAADCDITITTNGVKHSVQSGCKKAPAKTPPKAPAKPKPTPKPPVKVPQTVFKNCTELNKVYPKGVSKTHKAYQAKMDRDKDGWACEK